MINPAPPLRIFLAGIMQGSHLGKLLHHQGYREQLKTLLIEHLPGATVYDPLADHQRSVNYDDETGRQVFFEHNRMCKEETDVLVAFVPEASMGTAVEMWEAYQANRCVLTISPLAHNWVIRFLSHAVYPDIETFIENLTEGQVARKIDEVLRQ